MRRALFLSFLLCLAWLCFTPQALHADTLTLKDGRSLKGSVRMESEDKVQFDQCGVLITIPRDRIHEILKENPIESLLHEARQMEKENRLEAALARFDAIYRSAPSCAEAAEGRERALTALIEEFHDFYSSHYEQGRFEQVLARIEERLPGFSRDNPLREVAERTRIEVLLLYCRSLHDHLETERANAVLNRTILLQPEDPQACVSMCQILMDMDRHTEAAKMLRTVAALPHAPIEGRLCLMESAFKSDDPATGLALWEEFFSSKTPDDVPEDVLVELREECGPFVGPAYQARAEEFAALGQNNEALDAWEKGAALIPETIESLEQDVSFFKKIGASMQREAAEAQMAMLRRKARMEQNRLNLMAEHLTSQHAVVVPVQARPEIRSSSRPPVPRRATVMPGRSVVIGNKAGRSTATGRRNRSRKPKSSHTAPKVSFPASCFT